MKITVFVDESGTHDASPIMVMSGYVGTDEQWAQLALEWSALLQQHGLKALHAVDLFNRRREFRGWSPEKVNEVAAAAERIISKNLQLGFSVVLRDDDYESIYRDGAETRHPKDSKYGVCFRACLAFVPSYIASEILTEGQDVGSHNITIDFVVEKGHRNLGNARSLFESFKKDALPEWKSLVGKFDVVDKDAPGGQAADFLAYSTYRLELNEHSATPTMIEESSYAGVPDEPVAAPSSDTGQQIFRLPITREILGQLRATLVPRDLGS